MSELVDLGVKFTFVTAAGDRREYEVSDSPTNGQDLASVVRLRNLSNDRSAWATIKWLREGDRGDGIGYWERAA